MKFSGVAILLTLMLVVFGGRSVKAQRVYATIQTSSPKQEINILLGTVTLSEVQNQANAVNSSNLADYSTLSTTLGALSLIEAWQNLRFATQPPSNSPVTIMFGANTSVADVINGISIQPTLNGSLVGSAYSGSTILGLLGSGTIDKEITLPAPGVAYDGVRYRVSPSLLGVAVSGRYYYAFFITPPTINAATICNGSTATLTVTNPQSGYTYNWYNSGGTLVKSSTDVFYTTSALTASTTYSVEAVETGTTNYYSGKTSVAVTVNNPPTQATTGSNQSLCSVTTTTITGNTPGTGTGSWTQVSGPVTAGITSPSSASTGITGMNVPGSYVFRWTISNAPCPSSSADITVVVGAPVTTSNAGTAQNLCNITSATLAGNNPTVGTGTWTRVSGPNTPTFTNANLYNTTVTGLIPGDYVFQWTITSGSCTPSSSTVSVKVSAPPTIADAGTDQNLCNVTTATLAGNTPTVGTGSWTRISGPNTPVITTPSIGNSTITGMVPGTYVFRWTISNTPCPASTDDVSITISAPPTTANAGPNQLLCSVSSTTLAGNSPTVGTGLWSVVSGPNTPAFANASAYNTNVTGLTTGTYVLRWTISNGSCTASTSDVTIVVDVTPVVTLGSSPNACIGTTNASLTYTVTSGTPVSYSISWGSSASNGFLPVSDSPLPVSPIVITVPLTTAVGTFSGTITFKNSNGCTSTPAGFNVIVHPKPATPSLAIE